MVIACRQLRKLLSLGVHKRSIHFSFVQAKGRSDAADSIDLNRSRVAVSGEGVVVCWHPKQPHPYEHSLAVERTAEKWSADSVSVGILKDEVKAELTRRYYPQGGPTDQELQRIFYTTKHEWQPRPTERRLRSTTAPDPKYRQGI